MRQRQINARRVGAEGEPGDIAHVGCAIVRGVGTFDAHHELARALLLDAHALRRAGRGREELAVLIHHADPIRAKRRDALAFGKAAIAVGIEAHLLKQVETPLVDDRLQRPGGDRQRRIGLGGFERGGRGRALHLAPELDGVLGRLARFERGRELDQHPLEAIIRPEGGGCHLAGHLGATWRKNAHLRRVEEGTLGKRKAEADGRCLPGHPRLFEKMNAHALAGYRAALTGLAHRGREGYRRPRPAHADRRLRRHLLVGETLILQTF